MSTTFVQLAVINGLMWVKSLNRFEKRLTFLGFGMVFRNIMINRILNPEYYMVMQSGIVLSYNESEEYGHLEIETGECILFFRGEVCETMVLKGKQVKFRMHQFLQFATLLSSTA